MKILITGARGHFGKATIDFLLRKGISANQISALTRNEEKAADLKAKGIEVKIGTYDDPASLIAAFKGVEQLLFVSGSDVVHRQKQHENIVDAAIAAGIKQIIYTSFVRKSDTSSLGIMATAHVETDKLIKASGTDLENLLGRKPASLKEYLNSIYNHN